MSAHTIADLIAEGPPDDEGRARFTHEQTGMPMSESAGRLLYGLTEHGVVRRDYAWKRMTGSVRLESGRIRQAMSGQPGLLPALVSASLETLAGEKPSPSRVSALAYSDVLYLLFDRVIEITGVVPIALPWKCPGCGGDAPTLARKDVSVWAMDYEPSAPPQAVAWLDEPLQHGEKSVEALIVSAASWAGMYQGASMADMRNPEWAQVASVLAGTVGYVSGGEAVAATIPRATLMNGIAFREWARLSAAVTQCAGVVFPVAVFEHSCGDLVQVPFDFSTTM